MSMISYRDRLIIVGVIVALTALFAYGSPFPSAVRVTIAMVGVTLAFVVGDRLRLRAEARDDAQTDTDELG